MKDFRDKEVLITGSASGIGRETALAFAEAGARLWLADVDETGNQETARLVRDKGTTGHPLHCNVADETSVRAMAEEVHGEIEALDVLMNNAGVGTAGRFLDTTLENWRRTLDINLMGVVHGCHAFLPNMVARGEGGHVINTASAAGYYAAPDIPVYAASKFAVQGFTEALRADMAQHSIGVTAICPGIIDTPIVAKSVMEGKMSEGDRQSKIVDFYHKRNYTPAQVAQAILKAVRHNVAVQPVSPEAWGLYVAKRLTPGVLGRLSRSELPFLK
ncbi:SDR family NAD(P)-dependent oxidoreductase [Tamilnaduibacter salinus]|nr:SDR family NAD(P)-dependent oxidoreductase [Tamilnaduibacter salinus]